MNDRPVQPQVYQALVEDKIHLSPDYYLLKLSLNNFRFLAGQYLTFHVRPPKLRHTMSIASPPNGNSIEILQCVAPGGQGSRWTQDLSAGIQVQFTGPLGRFTLSDSPRKKVFVATGCGIAPFRSMILDYLGQGGQSQVVLYWGMRHEKDLFWQDEFKNLAVKCPNFHYDITLSQPEDGWTGARGRVTTAILAEQNLPDSDFYLCGSSEMVKDVKTLLLSKQVPELQIKTELFF